jgi:hypothetical protein
MVGIETKGARYDVWIIYKPVLILIVISLNLTALIMAIPFIRFLNFTVYPDI